jgi:FtsZ-interacting cell division protein ZipA
VLLCNWPYDNRELKQIIIIIIVVIVVVVVVTGVWKNLGAMMGKTKLRWRDKECIQNFGGETWETVTSKTDEIVGKYYDESWEIGLKMYSTG